MSALLWSLQFYGQQGNGKLFIIGGGQRTDALIERMATEANLKENDFVAIFPQASAVKDSAYIWAAEEFWKRGYKTIDFNFEEGETLPPSKLNSLKEAKIIYLGGGDQNKLMRILNQAPAVKDAIHKAYYEDGKLIAGTSAGAAVMSKMMITGDQQREDRRGFSRIEKNDVVLGTGLGFLSDWIVDQHFIIRSRYNRLVSALLDHSCYKGLAIDESTAVLVSGRTAEVVGESQVIVFTNNTGSNVTLGNKLRGNFNLQLYIHGDRFPMGDTTKSGTSKCHPQTNRAVPST